MKTSIITTVVILAVSLLTGCATFKSNQLPYGIVSVECTNMVTLQSHKWTGKWEELDFNVCDEESEYVIYDAAPKRLHTWSY